MMNPQYPHGSSRILGRAEAGYFRMGLNQDAAAANKKITDYGRSRPAQSDIPWHQNDIREKGKKDNLAPHPNRLQKTQSSGKR
jgi:hypothetical protein